MGTWGYWPSNHNLRHRLLDSFIAGYGKARGYLSEEDSLLVAAFSGRGQSGAVFFTRCIIGVYYRCVYCGKQCRFPFILGFEGLVLICSVLYCFLTIIASRKSISLLEVASEPWHHHVCTLNTPDRKNL